MVSIVEAMVPELPDVPVLAEAEDLEAVLEDDGAAAAAFDAAVQPLQLESLSIQTDLREVVSRLRARKTTDATPAPPTLHWQGLAQQTWDPEVLCSSFPCFWFLCLFVSIF